MCPVCSVVVKIYWKIKFSIYTRNDVNNLDIMEFLHILIPKTTVKVNASMNYFGTNSKNIKYSIYTARHHVKHSNMSTMYLLFMTNFALRLKALSCNSLIALSPQMTHVVVGKNNWFSVVFAYDTHSESWRRHCRF